MDRAAGFAAQLKPDRLLAGQQPIPVVGAGPRQPCRRPCQIAPLLQRSRQAGMNEHLSKPIELTELQEALLRWARRSASDSPQSA